jgi:Ca-activated chloride channel family protein
MMAEENISVQLNFDQELTPREESSERILELALRAPEVDGAFQRSPLNVALVLDRSGSMSGTKLAYVKQAARHVVDLLADTDRVALVAYDHDVRVLFPSILLDNESRPVLWAAIESIRAGGTTNLFGGWLTGCEQVAEAAHNGTINRALLLTDGLANVGTTDPQELATHSRELADRGVSTSTFGVGTDFNHHLLEEMANQGDGRFHFIESPVDIPGIFEREFKDLLTVHANQIEATLDYPPELQVSVPGDWRQEQPEPGKLKVYLGSLSAGQNREVYMRLSIPAGLETSQLPFKITVLFRDQNGELAEAASEGVIRLTSREEAESAPRDEALLERFAQVDLADTTTRALKLEQEGQLKKASDLVRESLKKHSEKINEEGREYYRSTSERMMEGMDERDRKRTHADAYRRKQRR